MNRNNRPPHPASSSHIPSPYPGRAATPSDARIAAMRARGMSTRAIRRAFGLSAAAATAAGILDSRRGVVVPTPGRKAANARGSGGRKPHMDEVLDAVACGAGIDRGTLIEPGQRRSAVRARQLVMYLIRELCPQISLVAIGLLLDRDHTTVLYGCRRAAVLLRRDRAFRAAYQRARRVLGVRKARSRG